MKAQSALVYGKSGSGKTTQIFRLVRWILNEARKINPKARFRLISADGGGVAPFELSGYIEQGLVEFFDITHRIEALADIRRLGAGFWPLKPNTKDELFDTSKRCMTADWENICGYAIEGITSIGRQWINHFADQEAGMGFKHSWIIKEAEYTIGGLDKGHYGIVQKEIYKLMVHGFNSLPTKWILWSALVDRDEDKNLSRQIMLGPQAVGSAITFEIPSWLGTTLYLEPRVGQTKEGEEIKFVAAHFENGKDQELDIPFVTKCRVLEDVYGEFKKTFPKGYVQCVAGKRGIEYYFQKQQELINQMYGE